MLGNFSGKARAVAIVVNKPRAYDGEGDSEEGGDFDVNAVLEHPDVKKQIQAMLDNEVAGLKNKNSELLDKMKKASDTAKQFEGLDVEKLKEYQKQIESNEEMKLLSEGKIEEVVDRRVELLKKDHENQVSALNNKLSEMEGLVGQKDNKLRELVVDGMLREAYTALDFEPTAMTDMIRNGREVFVMGEDGKVTPRDEHGNVIFGKDGKTPITAEGWLEMQSETRQYLRRQSNGGGAHQNRGAGANFDKMSPVGKIAQGLKNMGIQ